MKERIKGFIAGILVCALFMCVVSYAEPVSKSLTAFFNGITVSVDGTVINLKDSDGNAIEPFNIDGTVYLPIRAISEALGKPVTWDQELQRVFVGERPDEEILVTFDGVNITKGDFVFALWQNYNVVMSDLDNPNEENPINNGFVNGIPFYKVLGETATEDVCRLIVAEKLANEKGISSNQEILDEIDASYESFVFQNGGTSSYMQSIQDAGVTDSGIRNYIRRSVLCSHLYDLVSKENSSLASVNEDSVWLDFEKEYVNVKHILVSGDKAESKAKDIIKQLGNGKKFENLIEKYNEDKGQDVDTGYVFTKGEMVKEFEDVSFALNEGEYTKEPVNTIFGYHIIKRYPLSRDCDLFAMNKENLIIQAQNEAFEKYLDSYMGQAVPTFDNSFYKDIILEIFN